jgi:hypothetical protein
MSAGNIYGKITLSLSSQSHTSVEFFSRWSVILMSAKASTMAGGHSYMKDWISDWKRWSRAERCFAIALFILSLIIPLGLLISGSIIGT